MSAAQILAQYFPLTAEDEKAEFAAFREALIDAIAFLLSYDIERLSQAMYRIDVQENAFRTALYANSAEQLADLAIERVKQKIAFRQKYPTS